MYGQLTQKETKGYFNSNGSIPLFQTFFSNLVTKYFFGYNDEEQMVKNMPKHDLSSVNSFVLRKQHLTKDTKTDDILQIVKEIIGLHATNATTPYLSLFARTCNFSKEHLDEELYVKRNLGKIRCMRKTVHILPKELIQAVYSATAKMVELTSEKYSQNLGVSRKQYEEASKAILETLKGTGMTTKEIKKGLETKVNISAVVNLMCDQGILIRGKPQNSWKSNIHTYYRFRDHFPDMDLDAVDEEKARELLIKRYVAAFGPVSLNDVVWWTGFRMNEVKRVLEKLQNQLTRIEIFNLKGDYLIQSSDVEMLYSLKPEGYVLNFLPSLDLYLMGYKERERYVNSKHFNYVFDGSGNCTSTILLNGEVIGVWDVARTEPWVKIFFFEEVEEAVLRDVQGMAKEVGRFIVDKDVQVIECDSMAPLTHRTAGGFMSPLKGS